MDLSNRLKGLRVAVDVQHLYRASRPLDRGSLYRLENGTTIAEADAARQYADAIVMFLRSRGADVLTNDPLLKVLVGEYWQRQDHAIAWGAHLYLACHLNAGRGSYGLIERMEGTKKAQRAAAWIIKGMLEMPEILVAQQRELRPGDRGVVCIGRSAHLLPTLLLEPFFGDTPKHQALLATHRLHELGEAIGRSISDWWQVEITGTLKLPPPPPERAVAVAPTFPV